MDANLPRRIVDLARLAPSVHNTQPWRWRVGRSGLELWADRSRALPVADPSGRNLLLSCGAALHHAVVAAEGLGVEAAVEHLPEGPGSDLLARIVLSEGRATAEAVERSSAISARRTDRRRFTAWPVPVDNLHNLADEGRRWGAEVLVLAEREVRARVEELVEAARRRQLADPRIAEETEAWIEHGSFDGVPEGAIPLPVGARGERPTRFRSGLVADPGEAILQGTDGVLVISTVDDGPSSQLHAGEALSALWLRATATGLSVLPLSQVVEVERTRADLQELIAGPEPFPQILVRVGWQEIGRNDLVRTPRRPLADVLVETRGA